MIATDGAATAGLLRTSQTGSIHVPRLLGPIYQLLSCWAEYSV